MINKIEEYEEKARKTAIYPNISENYQYPLLGLIEEAGEIDEKIHLGVTDLNELNKEFGDVYWYLTSCSFELKLNFNELLNSPIESDLPIGIEASKIAGYLKKIIRDDNGVMTDSKKDKIIISIKKIVFLLQKYQKKYNLNTLDIMKNNIEKLYSRKERGVLKGSGDNR